MSVSLVLCTGIVVIVADYTSYTANYTDYKDYGSIYGDTHTNYIRYTNCYFIKL